LGLRAEKSIFWPVGLDCQDSPTSVNTSRKNPVSFYPVGQARQANLTGLPDSYTESVNAPIATTSHPFLILSSPCTARKTKHTATTCSSLVRGDCKLSTINHVQDTASSSTRHQHQRERMTKKVRALEKIKRILPRLQAKRKNPTLMQMLMPFFSQVANKHIDYLTPHINCVCYIE
jgi:hypothetical protein